MRERRAKISRSVTAVVPFPAAAPLSNTRTHRSRQVFRLILQFRQSHRDGPPEKSHWLAPHPCAALSEAAHNRRVRSSSQQPNWENRFLISDSLATRTV